MPVNTRKKKGFPIKSKKGVHELKNIITKILEILLRIDLIFIWILCGIGILGEIFGIGFLEKLGITYGSYYIISGILFAAFFIIGFFLGSIGRKSEKTKEEDEK